MGAPPEHRNPVLHLPHGAAGDGFADERPDARSRPAKRKTRTSGRSIISGRSTGSSSPMASAPPSISSHGPPEISMTAPFPNPTVARSKGQPPRSGRWQQPLILGDPHHLPQVWPWPFLKIRPTAPFPMAERSYPTRQSRTQAPAQSNDGEIWRSSAALFFGFEWKSTAMAEPHQLQPDPNISPVRRDEPELKFWAAMDGFRSHDIGRQRAANQQDDGHDQRHQPAQQPAFRPKAGWAACFPKPDPSMPNSV
ncbi:hypothetical protein ACLOJK_029216 [Asimina triloba]